MDTDFRPLEPADPREVGGHRLLGRLGSGGMGTVFLGADPVSGGRVAVKTIHPHLADDPSYRRRFRDEAHLASRVASFCTARVLAQGEQDGLPYLVTDYVGGVSLHDRLTAGGPLPPADLHGVAVGVASALAAIHAAGLVHRDLKPANVMLTLSGCRVIDFGIAGSQDAPDDPATTGQVFGTPGWIAPEVLVGGPSSQAADIFSWGCLIAHAGTGQMPIGGDPATLRTAAGDADLSGLPDALVPLVRWALAEDPADRPTATDLLLALVEQPQPHAADRLAPRPVPPGDAPRRSLPPRSRQRRPVPGPPTPFRSRKCKSSAEDTDTRAFTPLGVAGATTSTRTRLLAGAGAAAGTLLVGAVVLGITGARAAPPSSPDAPGPSAPAVSAAPTKKAGAVRAGTSKRPPAKTGRQRPKQKPQEGKPKSRAKHAAKHGKAKGRSKH
ncbi:serine/threonine-protein kinase [Actinomadura mexicana]|uniref:Serine/threonine protein kinase n=1 Tax=Actinomadura mexicana TaxID=134959 RepID=A0A238UPL5_9ACTN|nr:serine/threonine-protein kinase [Actinomadura mexicana]SNR23453.1 Serine/threonine protein kinase [Actinomadura mexicana]